MQDEYRFTRDVQSACAIFAVLLGVLIMTLPVAVWFWVRRSSARLVFTDGACTIKALGLTTERWELARIARIGVLEVSMPNAGLGGLLAKKLSGGQVAVNVCAIFDDGTKKTFMASRFERSSEIVQRLTDATALPLEQLSRGLTGVKWPTHA